MLTFFSAIGLSARLSDLMNGGRVLGLPLAVCIAVIVLENLVGVGMATLFDAPPLAGLMAGSVALSGGHGTAAAWAPVFEESVAAAGTIGLASATFGLIAGGVVGGPLGQSLIQRNQLRPSTTQAPDPMLSAADEAGGRIDVPNFFASLLVIALAMAIGEELNALIACLGLNLPEFVTALFAGILIGNLGPVVLPRIEWPTHSAAMRLIAELSLSIFLVRALMSLQLWTLASVAGPLLIVLICQVAAVPLLAYFVLFRLLGSDYDAALMSSGFVGLSLGATPTAVANMSALSHKYGPSPTAFLVIPLVGAFFIDLVNAFVVSWLHGHFTG